MESDRQASELGRRLEVLERSYREMEARCRAWKRLGTAMAAVVVTAGLAGAAADKPEPTIVEAREFVLRGDDGSMRAALAIRPDGTPGLGLFDEQGRVRASLDIGTDGSSGVNLYDNTGTLRAAVAVRADNTPAVGLFDGQGKIQRSIELESR